MSRVKNLLTEEAAHAEAREGGEPVRGLAEVRVTRPGHSRGFTARGDELPEVEQREGFVAVGEWLFPFVVTREDVLAFVAAMLHFEEHPELVPDGD